MCDAVEFLVRGDEGLYQLLPRLQVLYDVCRPLGNRRRLIEPRDDLFPRLRCKGRGEGRIQQREPSQRTAAAGEKGSAGDSLPRGFQKHRKTSRRTRHAPIPACPPCDGAFSTAQGLQSKTKKVQIPPKNGKTQSQELRWRFASLVACRRGNEAWEST